MKILGYISLGLVITLVCAFFIIQYYMSKSSKDIETHNYEIIKKFEGFEIRRYEAANFSSVKLDTSSYENVSGKGFRILAGYIFGGNNENKKIAMTSPVTMEMKDSITMKFMIPSKYTIEELPRPNTNQISFSREQEKIVAAIQFGGWSNDKKLNEKKTELIKLLKKNNIEHNGIFSYLGYNPPYEVLNRRNEVIVELNKNAYIVD